MALIVKRGVSLIASDLLLSVYATAAPITMHSGAHDTLIDILNFFPCPAQYPSACYSNIAN